ncbi:NAD(P)-binding protein [Schizophyllum commune H4-8]|uniref:NAD(P)-binding protein n=1 Tax=Schizophyllum commune (strain H4-8 / FGSC 9210) TaxID=578458 RepID=D8Q947_SCHCM|nr:NAD(P)-binding protein [Schizophyllum commune H4-8]KAI5890555.1 NAD(P)-binding protein [Schizophyllum commune H4-8]
MPSASAARSYNAAQVPTTKDLPVAVFVGGTSGIGRAMASAFATHTNGRARIVIVGRNQKAAEDLRATLPSPAREQLLFIPCDMKLMRNVAAATRELAAHGVDKINYLVLSSGVLPAEGRIETEEGIDEKLAIAYYGRWKFVYELQEALAKAAAAGEPAKVLTVLAAGAGGPIELDDLGLKKNYGLIHTSKSQATYTDLMVEKFAELHPEVSFVHAYPGIVKTDLLSNASSGMLKALHCIMDPFITLIGNTAEDCAELMWYAVYQSGPGFARINPKGEDIGMKEYYGSEEAKELVWEHSLEVTRSRKE